MAKKIRFPLEMEDGIEVRSMDELRDHFSLGKVLDYVRNEKLVTWLRDRYENDIADAIARLDKADTELPKKVCELFDVPYSEKTEEELERAAERAGRLQRLKEFTEEKQFLDAIDKVAFSQDELYDLLDEDVKEIYLCGERFSIPLSMKGITYIGVNQPTVVIDSKTEVDWAAKEITLEAVTFDEKYQAVVDSANATKEALYEKIVETVKKTSIGEYPEKTDFSFMIPVQERESVKRMYASAKSELEKLNYDIDADIATLRKLVLDNGLIGIADRYISEL